MADRQTNYVLNYVYPSKAKYIADARDRFVNRKSSIVEVYDNATVLPVVKFNDNDVSHGRGGVVDFDGNYVEISKTKARVSHKYSITECDTIEEKAVYCGFFNKAWGHYLTEVVSRLWYALKNDDTVDSYVFIVEKDAERQFDGNYLEFLKMLGIADKIRIINKPTKFATVVVPEEGLVYDEYYTDEFVKMYEFINKRALAQYNGPKYDKVFFSKRKCEISIYSNFNEKFVDKFFEKNGYKIIYPEKLSLIETIGIMQNTKSFCALSSSLAHNQLFGHANQTMISIEKQAFFNPYQIFVANITGCECIFIDACRSIFTVGAAGPFIFDYTELLDKYVKDNGLKPGKPMSEFKFKRIFKKYLIHYFNLNNELPPDYMFRQYIVDMTREAYNDTVKSKKVFHMSLYYRIKIKLKKLRLKHLGF